MPNVTNVDYVKKYKIYPKQIEENISIIEDRNLIESKILNINRKISQDFGQSKHFCLRRKNESV